MSIMQDNKRDGGGRKLTGWHVLAILVTFFGVIFAVNGVMMTLAIRTFSGEVTRSSFTASQTYNKEIAAAQAQTDLGWAVQEGVVRSADGVATVTLKAVDNHGQPVGGVSFDARLEHPASRSLDREAGLAPVAGSAGVFGGQIAGIAAGQWELVVSATRDGKRIYLSRNRVVLR